MKKYQYISNTLFYRILIILIFLILILIPLIDKKQTETQNFLNLDKVLPTIIAVFASILAIAFPLSLSLISHLEQKFKVPGISKILFREKIFCNLLFGLTTIISLSIFNSFVEYNISPLSQGFFFLYSIYVFGSFIEYLLITRDYMTKTIEILYEKNLIQLKEIETNHQKDESFFRNNLEQVFGILKYEINNNLTQNSINTLAKIDDVFKEIITCTFRFKLEKENY